MDNTAFRDDAENGIQRLPLQELDENKLSEVDEIGDAGGARQRRVVPAEEAAETSPKEEEEEDYSLFSYFPQYPRYKARMAVLKQNEQLTLWVKGGLCLLLALLYGVYVISVVSIVSDIEIEDYWCNGDGLLLIITGVVAIFMLYFLVIKKFYGRQINNTVLKPLGKFISEYWSNRWVRLIVYLIPTIALLVFIIIDTAGDTSRLTSLFGTCCLIFAGFVFSHAPRKIIWRHVIWGLALQFIMGLMVLRWSVGRAVFQCAGDKVSAFLAYTDEGSKFVFGPLVDPMGIFGFQVLPVVLFFSFCIQILYYYGIMQWVVIKMGWLLQVTVGTTACESINAAANIFLGQTEAPLLIKPYLPIMTKSELHAVMTGGFATIAGSVMAAYISFGVSPAHLLSASVMSAPAALAYAKLFYPETEVSRTSTDTIKIERGTESNALHAACEGVVTAIPLVANIAANLITFIAFIALFNGVFDWSCQLVNAEPGVCTLENVSGYLFMPLAWVMGVSWDECHTVGTLLGLKTIVNEFVAYSALADLIDSGGLSARAQIISTYALCGFSNISAIGIQLGGIGALAPDRRSDLAKVVVRAMIAGSAACFLTACVAGTLLDEASLEEA